MPGRNDEGRTERSEIDSRRLPEGRGRQAESMTKVEGRMTNDEGRMAKDEGRMTKDEGRRTKDENVMLNIEHRTSKSQHRTSAIEGSVLTNLNRCGVVAVFRLQWWLALPHTVN
jgi:hypothetical protein